MPPILEGIVLEATDFEVQRGAFELRGWLAPATGGASPADGIPAAPAVLCLHETATTAEVFKPLATALSPRVSVAAIDRRGWGRSGSPTPYTRTTVEEQAADAEAAIAALGGGPALLAGAGLGAVAALALALREPELVAGLALVEPPLLAFLPEATEALSEDAAALREAAAGAATTPADAAMELYLAGGLPALGAGAGRIPEYLATEARRRPLTLFAELPAIAAWPLPLAALSALQPPTAVVVATSTPPLVRAAAEALVARLPGTAVHELASDGLPQLERAQEIAELLVELGSAAEDG